MLGGGVPTLQHQVIRGLDVCVQAAVGAIERHRRIPHTRSRDTHQTKQPESEGLMHHRHVLDHVVERQLLQAQPAERRPRVPIIRQSCRRGRRYEQHAHNAYNGDRRDGAAEAKAVRAHTKRQQRDALEVATKRSART